MHESTAKLSCAQPHAPCAAAILYTTFQFGTDATKRPTIIIMTLYKRQLLPLLLLLLAPPGLLTGLGPSFVGEMLKVPGYVKTGVLMSNMEPSFTAAMFKITGELGRIQGVCGSRWLSHSAAGDQPRARPAQ